MLYYPIDNDPANIRLDEDVLKTSFIFVFRRRLQDVFKTSWSRRIYSPNSYVFRRRLQDVLIKTNIVVLVIRLLDVLPGSLQNVLKRSSRHLAKVPSRHLQDVFKTLSKSLPDKDFWQKHLQDIFKTFSRHLEGLFKTFEDVFEKSSRRLAKISSRHFQEVWSSQTVLVNTISKGLWDVFKTFLRRTANTVIYTRICLGRTSEKFMVSVQNFQESQKFLKF